jgi:putative oxidoreductase
MYSYLSRVATLTSNADESIGRWGLTVLRVGIGAVFLTHGAQKLFQVGFGGVAALFESLHIPLPLLSAVAVTLVEFFGGIALVLGLFTRLAAALIAFDMLIAVFVVFIEPSFFRKSGIELPITLLAASIALVMSGPGAAALKVYIRNR